MKILLSSKADNGGGTWFLAKAINRYTEHEARQFRMKQCYLDYPYQMLEPSQAEMRALIEWCDVLHVRETAKHLHKSYMQKPTVVTYSGRTYRKAAKKLIESRRARGWLITVSTPDLPWYYPDQPPLWIPNTREDMIDYPAHKYTRFTLAHAPTFRDRKGTDEVIGAVRGLQDVDLELVEQSTYSQCLQRKSRCHLLFDQFANGYGNNAIEAWALGIPVITNDLQTNFTHHLEEACGYLPFAKVDKGARALRELIDRFHKDEAFYAKMVGRGRQFFFTYHHAPVVAKRAVEIYKMLLDGSHKSNYPEHPYPQAKRKAPTVVKERELNVLSLATWDYAGCGYLLSEAINKTTRHHSRAVRWRTSRLEFPYEIYRPTLNELADLWKWADVIHIHDNAGIRSNRVNPSPEFQMFRELPPKPTVITHHGSRYRRYTKYFNQIARDYGWLQTCSTLDLSLYSPYWLPDCRPDLSKYVDRDGFVVCHAPTNRRVKDTSTVIKAMSAIGDFELIEGLTWQNCIKKKGRASVLVDQFQLGYGCNSIEAWAMGQAVVGNAPTKVLQLYDEVIGHVPFAHCECDARAIRDTVERLRDDEAYYKDVAERGHQCWQDFHSPEAAAKQALAYYHQAMLGGPAMLGRAGYGDEVSKSGLAGRVSPSASVRQKSAKQEVREPKGELVLVRYIGSNSLDMTWFGEETGKRYELGGIRRQGYVFAEDLPALLAAVGKVGEPQFRVVK